jgi:tRNA(Arg) A34 adenosine deaminase TadA
MVPIIAWPNPAWQQSFELAWESLRGGSIPVGAAVVDPDGQIIATGRNRRFDKTAPPGELAGSAIAHAEMNALATLPPDNYAEHTLYTTLEPCLLCTSALRIARIGTVRYAAADAVWAGVDDIPHVLTSRAARLWTKREGPLDGVLARWSGAMHAYWFLENAPDTLDGPEPLAEPYLVEIAGRLAEVGVFDDEVHEDALRRAMPLLSE